VNSLFNVESKGKCSPEHAMKAAWGWRYKSTHAQLRH